MRKSKDELTRKDFIKKTAGVVAFGLMSNKTFSQNSNPNGQKRALPIVKLGKSGIKASCIGYGATRTKEPSLVRAILDNDINFIDTGRSYANGKNEEMLGVTLKGIRKNVVIQSKTKYRLLEPGEWLCKTKIL